MSGPEIFGAQTVTVAADGYETSSLVDVNAQEATFLLQPLRGGGGGGGGTPPPPPPPAQVRGRVFGFAKEFFDPAALAPNEIALAIVVTSARDEFGGSGSGGELGRRVHKNDDGTNRVARCFQPAASRSSIKISS